MKTYVVYGVFKQEIQILVQVVFAEYQNLN